MGKRFLLHLPLFGWRALGLIKDLGHGGVFLGERHTVDFMRQALSLPVLSDRESYEGWERSGKLSRVEVARRKVEEILREHTTLPVPEDIKKSMDDVVAAYSD
jgi:trimethylamine:corrinoid methyltransferase-like protein